MRIYLSGAMSGIPDHNFPTFHAAAAKLRSLGHDVVNPAEIPHASTDGWTDFLRRDIAHLVTCDGVALLPGWEFSKGAKLEVHIASELGMAVMHLDVMPAADEALV